MFTDGLLLFAMNEEYFHFLLDLEGVMYQNRSCERGTLRILYHFSATFFDPFKFISIPISVKVFEFFLLQNADWIDLAEVLDIL